MEGIDKGIGVLGRALVVAGIVPMLVLLALNVAAFTWDWGSDRSLDQRIGDLTSAEALLVIFSTAAVGASVLFGLNGAIIRWYEGRYPIQRLPLLPTTRRNLARHERLYGRLEGLRDMYEGAAKDLRRGRGDDDGEARRRVDSLRRELGRAHEEIERQHELRPLPLRKVNVKGTALGNVYAVLEEYSYERYRIDSVVFWPRLIAVVPGDYRESIGTQKTTCDLLLHTSVVLSVFAVEAGVAAAAGLPAAVPRGVLAALAPLSLIAGYGFYRAAVAETVVLGKLIGSAFDLYRHDLMRQLGVEPPRRLAEERVAWLQLAAFVRRGDEFYFPAPSAPASEPATDNRAPGASQGRGRRGRVPRSRSGY